MCPGCGAIAVPLLAPKFKSIQEREMGLCVTYWSLLQADDPGASVGRMDSGWMLWLTGLRVILRLRETSQKVQLTSFFPEKKMGQDPFLFSILQRERQTIIKD